MQTKFNFPGLTENEKVYLVFRKHWISLIKTIFIVSIMAIIPFFFYFIPELTAVMNLSSRTMEMFSIFYYIVLMSVFMASWASYLNNTLIVTNKRIINIQQIGFFNHKISDLPLEKIKDLSTTKNGLLAQAFKYGDIKIHAFGGIKNFNFENTPYPYKAATNIKHVIELYTASKGHFSNKQIEG